MTTTPRFTSADLELLPDDGKRYEIIDGELYVSRQPHVHHQRVCFRIASKLQQWSEQAGGSIDCAWRDLRQTKNVTGKPSSSSIHAGGSMSTGLSTGSGDGSKSFGARMRNWN